MGLRPAGRAHRALADAEMAARLLAKLEAVLVRRFGIERVTHELLRDIQEAPRDALGSRVARYSAR